MTRIGLIIILALAAGTAHDLPAHGGQAEAPAFHASTCSGSINVVVHEKREPVANLTRDDFSLSDRGKPQTISVFSVQSVSTNAGRAQLLPENTFSNYRHGAVSTPSSVTIVLLDRLNTLTSPAAVPYETPDAWAENHALISGKEQLLRFVKEMAPKDHMAIYSPGHSLTALCDFTSDRQELMAVLTKYRATALTSREVVEPGSIHTPTLCCAFDHAVDRDRRNLANIVNTERAATTMTALMQIAAHVSQILGRKNLVWLTSNLPFSGAEISRIFSRANIAIYPVDVRGLLPRSAPEGDPLPTVTSLHRSGLEPPGLNAMREMAEQTGGLAFLNTNDVTGAIQRQWRMQSLRTR